MDALDGKDGLRLYEHLRAPEHPDGLVRILQPNDFSLVVDTHEQDTTGRVGKGAEGARQTRRLGRNRLKLKDVALTTAESAFEVRHGGL